MNIKVQIIGGASTTSAITSGFDAMEKPLTFYAFSDAMKARILENFLKSPAKIGIAICDESPKVGEWHEDVMENAIWNK